MVWAGGRADEVVVLVLALSCSVLSAAHSYREGMLCAMSGARARWREEDEEGACV